VSASTPRANQPSQRTCVCCARDTRGQAATAPPARQRNSRRLINTSMARNGTRLGLPRRNTMICCRNTRISASNATRGRTRSPAQSRAGGGRPRGFGGERRPEECKGRKLWAAGSTHVDKSSPGSRLRIEPSQTAWQPGAAIAPLASCHEHVPARCLAERRELAVAPVCTECMARPRIRRHPAAVSGAETV
jgi:hypothetical protein